jgi:hypothetical protein
MYFLFEAEPVFVKLLRSPGIDSQPGGIDSSESISGLIKSLQIRALSFTGYRESRKTTKKARKIDLPCGLGCWVERGLESKTTAKI